MAFDPILNATILPGEPNTTDLWSKTRLNQLDHEGRILTLEGASLAFMPLNFDLYGEYHIIPTFTGYTFFRITFNITVQAGRVMAHTAGTAGSTEIDILFKRGVASFVSLFNTRPTVAFGTGDLGIGTGVLNPSNVNLLAGDILRADLTASQTNGKGLSGILEYDKT